MKQSISWIITLLVLLTKLTVHFQVKPGRSQSQLSNHHNLHKNHFLIQNFKLKGIQYSRSYQVVKTQNNVQKYNRKNLNMQQKVLDQKYILVKAGPPCADGQYQQTPSNNCNACNPSCLTCITNPTTCTSCVSSKYLTVGNTCNSCSSVFGPNCISCVLSTCLDCSYGLYPSGPVCMSCSLSNCLDCISSTVCTDCAPFYIIQNGVCVEQCGDGYVLYLPCDIKISQRKPLDGCSDSCQIETNFLCTTTNHKSTCTYTSYISMTYVGCQKDDYKNAMTLTFKASLDFPEFYEDNFPFLSIISLNNSEISMKSFTYQSGQLKIYCTYNTDIHNKTLKLYFSPASSGYTKFSTSLNSQIQFTLNPTKLPLYYQSSSYNTYCECLYYLYLAIICLGLALSFISMFLRQLAGLQFMLITQYAVIGLLWYPHIIYLPNYSMGQFAWLASGYNYRFLGSSVSWQMPLEQYGLNNVLLSNWNITPILSIAFVLLLSPIIKLLTYCFEKQNLSKDKINNRERCKDIFSFVFYDAYYYLFLFNMQAYLAYSIVFFVNFSLINQLWAQILSCFIFAIFGFATIFGLGNFFMKFYCYKMFWKAFNLNALLISKFYILVMLNFVALHLFSYFIQDYSIMLVIPPSLLMVYVGFQRPYKYLYDNLRFGFFLIIVQITSVMKILYTFNSPQENRYFLAFPLIIWILLLLAFLSSILSILHSKYMDFFEEVNVRNVQQINGTNLISYLDKKTTIDNKNDLKPKEEKQILWKLIQSAKLLRKNHEKPLFKQTQQISAQNALQMQQTNMNQMLKKQNLFVRAQIALKLNDLYMTTKLSPEQIEQYEKM